MPQKEWPPLQPPLPFPSQEARGEIIGDDGHSRGEHYTNVPREDKDTGDLRGDSDYEGKSVPPPLHESKHTEL